MQQIDIRQVIRSKNPTAARWIPSCALHWFERFLRLDRINRTLAEHGHEPPLQFIRSTLEEIGVEYAVEGAENLPATHRVIFAANHPLGGLDGLILAEALAPYVGQPKLIVNDLLMNLEPLAPIFAPVNKHGAQNSQYARRMVELYEGDQAIITFPAGLCSRLIGGRITDPPWKRNFAVKAWDSGRPVVPVYVEGRNSNAFYRFARWRKRLGIKVNLEMLWLPKEMFDQRGKRITIRIGPAIEPTGREASKQGVEQIRKAVYSLQKGK